MSLRIIINNNTIMKCSVCSNGLGHPLIDVTMKMSAIIFTFFILTLVSESNCAKNNVCPTFQDYYTLPNNSKCWYDFAAEGNATEIITFYGYPVESHQVTTEDGYILTMFRIPNTKAAIKKGPVFIQTGVLMSAASFIAIGKKSLAFLLSDAGYDVWLGNYRGDEYSEGHVNLSVYDKRYWDYSADEIGIYDIPAFIEYICEVTGERGNIVYIGYSLGTLVAMMYGTEYPEAAKRNIKLFILLAPAGGFSNVVSPIKYIMPFFPAMLDIFNNFDLIRIVSHATTQKQLFRLICLESPKLMELCQKAANLLVGIRSQTDPEILRVAFSQVPAGLAFKVLKQVGDIVLGPYGKYDYGRKNIAKYGTIRPPMYNVTTIDVPIYLMYAVGDWFCGQTDSQIFYNKLSAVGKRYGYHEIGVPNFNHGDFVYGRNVKTLVYDRILSLLSNI